MGSIGTGKAVVSPKNGRVRNRTLRRRRLAGYDESSLDYNPATIYSEKRGRLTEELPDEVENPRACHKTS